MSDTPAPPSPIHEPQAKTTTGMLWVAFLAVTVRYFCANMTILGHTFGPFEEGEALVFLGPIATLYFASGKLWKSLDRDGDGKPDIDIHTLDHIAKLAQKTGHPLAAAIGKAVDAAIPDEPPAPAVAQNAPSLALQSPTPAPAPPEAPKAEEKAPEPVEDEEKNSAEGEEKSDA